MRGIKLNQNIKKEIIKTYLENKFSKSQIAINFGVNRSTIINILKKNNIKIEYERIYTEQEAIQTFEKSGCKLLSKFKNGFTPVEYLCICGHKSKIRFFLFLKGIRCRNCLSKKF